LFVRLYQTALTNQWQERTLPRNSEQNRVFCGALINALNVLHGVGALTYFGASGSQYSFPL
jgi:hypothetical protein